MRTLHRLLWAGLSILAFSTQALAQWPALYFRADPFLRLDLSRPTGGSGFGMALYGYTAESYFDGHDKTPHTSKAEAPAVRFQREEYIFSGVLGLSQRTAVVLAVPVSYVKQRLFESGEWGVEKVWGGVTHALDRRHHLSVLAAFAVPVDGPIGELHSPVAARDHSGFVTAQAIVTRSASGYLPEVYVRTGVGMYTSKEEYYGRRLYEFPAEFRATYPLANYAHLGLGGEGRFVVGSPDNQFFAQTLSSHDAFAFGPDLILRLTRDADLHATYRHEVFGFYATAGSYWNVSMVVVPSSR